MNKVEEVVLGMQKANLPSDYWITPVIELPELEAVQLIIQRNGQSVWEHTMSVIDLLTIKNPITLLSGLFHDLGKGCVAPMGNMSFLRFPDHAEESAKIAKMRLAKWGATSHLIDLVGRLVSTHMFDISNAMREKTIRKFLANIGPGNVENWFVVRIADSRSYVANQRYYSHFIEPFRRAVTLYIDKQPNRGRPIFERPIQVGSIQIKGGNEQ